MPTFFEGIGRLLKVVFGLLGMVTLTIVIGASFLYYHFTRNLPKIGNITDYRPPVVSEVYANDGTKIGEFWQECRYLLPYAQIPRRIIDAFVASEDERFWEHKGVDFQSILRAFIENLRAGHVVQGGSTITQQVTRSLLLTREKRLERKIKEAILATQLEQNLSKEMILYLYLNQIYLGNRAYGIQAASRNYFQKDAKDLNLAEISMIAGLPSAPTNSSPINSVEMARQRQLHVLSRMLENGYISRKEFDEAVKTPLTVYRAGTDKDFNNRVAPYFVEHVRRHIEEKYGQPLLYYGGLKIETTAGVAASKAADRAVKRGLLELERRRGFRGPVDTIAKDKIKDYAEAVHRELVEFLEPIRIPPTPAESSPNQPQRGVEGEAPTALPMEGVTRAPSEDGQIYKGVIESVDARGVATVLVGNLSGTISPQDRAWTGRTPRVGDVYWVKRKQESSFSIEQEPRLESSLISYNPLSGEVKSMVGGFSFKRSEFNRATQALRQPGSSFKPIVYAAALDKGYTAGTTIIDAAVEYQVGRDKFWSPKNYSNKYNGPMSVRSALTHSVNVVAVKVLHDIGIYYAVAFARKLGVVSPIQKYLSSALGASDTTLIEMTRAYGTFPAGGARPDLIFIRRISDKEEKILEETESYALDADHVFDRIEVNSSQGLNSDLMMEGEKAIKDDHLKLSPDEIKILYGSSIPPGRVITPQTAFLMVNLMKDVIDYGTGFKAKALNRPAAGKTGTTNDFSDAWFIAFVPDLITGVWTGYDSRKSMGGGWTGGVISAPTWLYYMQEVLKDTPVKKFAVPTSIKTANLDSLTGGSALRDMRPEPEELEIPEGNTPASRGVDFLYQDLNKL